MIAGNKITTAIQASIDAVSSGITNRSCGYEILDEANLLDGSGNIPANPDYKYVQDDDFFTGIINYLTRRNQVLDCQPLLQGSSRRSGSTSSEQFIGFGDTLKNRCINSTQLLV